MMRVGMMEERGPQSALSSMSDVDQVCVMTHHVDHARIDLVL